MAHEVRIKVIYVTCNMTRMRLWQINDTWSINQYLELLKICIKTCSIADVAQNDVQISREGRQLQDKLSEANKGLVEKTCWIRTEKDSGREDIYTDSLYFNIYGPYRWISLSMGKALSLFSLFFVLLPVFPHRLVHDLLPASASPSSYKTGS